ncbi:MAG: class I SAM-dependent methyltransferase [Candidatus Helarchaeota archaeon]
MKQISQSSFEQMEIQTVVDQIELCQEIYECQINSLNFRQDMKILDFACGPGISTKQIASKMMPTKIHAFDINPEMIKHARQHVKPLKNVEFSVQDGKHTNFSSDYFDVIYVRNFFAIIQSSPSSYLKEIGRILKNDGTLVLVESNNYGYNIYPLSRWVESRRCLLREIPYNFEIAGNLPFHLSEDGFRVKSLKVHCFSEVGPASPAFREQWERFYERLAFKAPEFFGSIQEFERDKRAFFEWCDNPDRLYYEPILLIQAQKIK